MKKRRDANGKCVEIKPPLKERFTKDILLNWRLYVLLLPGFISLVLFKLLPVGGIKVLLVGAVLATSLAMLFPISTPPNALAHSTGLVTTKDMTKIGIMIGVIGFVLGYGVLFLIGI